MTEVPRADLALARRLERAEGLSNIAFIEARARLEPRSGAAWREVAGTYAMFDGPGSPCTQTFGLGISAPIRAEVLGELEQFFVSRGAPVYHEVSPLADATVLELLPPRGYRPIEMSSVMYRLTTDYRGTVTPKVKARLMEPGEESLWAETAAAGWQDVPGVGSLVEDLSRVVAHTENTVCFLAEAGGRSVAAGALSIREGIALLAGASTRVEWRGKGAQTALLAIRLQYAAATGADVAMICAAPGSASQRNAERQGFRIAYTRTKWELNSRRE